MAAANPFSDPLRFERRAPPCVIVIFGANGDLTKRKLMPALYRLAYERRIPAEFAVIGNSRTAMSDQQFRDRMREEVSHFLEGDPIDAGVWESFAAGLYYLAGDLNDSGFYQALATKIGEVETKHRTDGNVLFYLSTQPSHYARVVEGTGAAGLQ